ncbi:hypothetical protein QYE76_030516 [Lolium multiflorum]|uniref:RING-type E3 ubiquitin transferase n=1 Tax=Lolium multiflorum TaxID=4521 RepID=A0AAD8VJD9_LOLMU|nr:hypothetical protein QYE76_030516 [Lolium multiflorum]
MSAAISGSIERDVLECPICMDPLQPPVYQCAVGHAICSSCHASLMNKDMCHTCSATGGYNRCNALDKILESFRVPCTNAKYGCTAESHYHEADEHKKSCPHTPCFCPEPDCVFAGSTVALLAHLTGDHMWPSTELKYNFKLTVDVQEGIHALHNRDAGLLFLMKFTPVPPFGHATSVLCVDPHATATEEAECKFRCHLSSSNIDIGWQKTSDFQVRSTNLSEGLLAPEDGGYSFVAPNTASITVSIARIMRDKRGNEIRLKRLRQSLLPYAIAT